MKTLLEALTIAWSFLRIPKLFLSLIFFPLLLSLLLVLGQLVMTGLFVMSIGKDKDQQEHTIEQQNKKSLIRKLVYGSFEPLADLKVCRWTTNEQGIEVPPTDDCAPDKLDAALHVENPETYDVRSYVRVFNGNFERLHVCKQCSPDIVINPEFEDAPKSIIQSTIGIGLIRLAVYHEHVQDRYLVAAEELKNTIDLFGTVYLDLEGFRSPIRVTGINESLAGLANVAMLIVIALWLAIRAHKNVLDYFARNGALLPMVAATGKKTFYASIWIITATRVVAFLGAAIPFVIHWLYTLQSENGLLEQFHGDYLECMLWLLTLSCSFGLATFIASIAELKHRHTVVNFLYRYFPLLCCFAGALLWVFSFVFDGTGLVSSASVALFRDSIAAFPIIGLAPVLLAPIFKPSFTVLFIHMTLSAIAVVLVTRYNAQWFGAHLEEL